MKKLSHAILSAVLSGILIAQGMVVTGCSLPFVQRLLTDLQKVERQVPVAIQIVDTLVKFAAPEYAPAVDAIAAQLNGDLNAISAVLVNYQKNLQGVTPGDLSKLQALVAAVNGQLPQILTGLHVFDVESQKYAQAVVSTVSILLAEIGALLPAGTVLTPNGARANAPKVKILTESAFKAQFNAAQHKVHI